MHKVTSAARYGVDKMTPFSPFRSNTADMANFHKRPSIDPPPVANPNVTLSFNVPFNHRLAGPKPEDVVYSTAGAFARWTHPPADSPNYVENAEVHDLPIHRQNVAQLQTLLQQMELQSGVSTFLKSSITEPNNDINSPLLSGLVVTVSLHGDIHTVKLLRARILNELPITLRSTTLPVEFEHVFINREDGTQAVREWVPDHMTEIAKHTKADIFLLYRKPTEDTASAEGELEDNRPRFIIFGDASTEEHARIRMLVMIDKLHGRMVDSLNLELSLHALICGRTRKHVQQIESMTGTAIYFPPVHPGVMSYQPRGATRRNEDEIVVSGKDQHSIKAAMAAIANLAQTVKAYMKEVQITPTKIDAIILERLPKVQQIMEQYGSYVCLPRVGRQEGYIRVQATDVLNVERTIRELMTLASQFYHAEWRVITPFEKARLEQKHLDTMLADICHSSGAEMLVQDDRFYVYGSDDAVKHALHTMSGVRYLTNAHHTLRVKLELANEHKEFVSGKKNGKINKIMSHANVQIVFDGFNDYNFYIDVRGPSYDATKNGLELVEAEMPAAISFHVPDQYHKRIIGIGGQHIQRIMKKYSVFVKFSNAMDRGSMNGRDDEDLKVDNVICRTPARNAVNLELVKNEIMDLVDKTHAEFVSEKVRVDRMYQRELLTHHKREIEELEKKWNCKVQFPGTEQASDIVTISGPEYQIPNAVDEFLGMVHDSHELAFSASEQLKEYLSSDEIKTDILVKMKEQYCVEVEHKEDYQPPADLQDGQLLVLNYTRNNQGGLKDAIDFLITSLVTKGLDAASVKGSIPRPKSDTFEDSLPFFESKLLHSAASLGTDSPTRSVFEGTEADGNGFFSKIRRGPSMSSFTSLIDGRKNRSNSPGSLFKHASSNASKASLISLESQGSSYRNPWNDSGINLPEEDHAGPSHQMNGSGWPTPTPPQFITPKFPYQPGMPAPPMPGDATPTSRYDPRASVDSGRPSTSHSFSSGYPGPIGPPVPR